jgi:hypothetical protein
MLIALFLLAAQPTDPDGGNSRKHSHRDAR